jgi:Fur family transcriptional regulator, ferric uptake regulator
MQITESMILEAGLRPTKARTAVLKTIADANSALSHAEILTHLAGQKEFDRVTIYRVLDWLTEHQLIHRISGDNRAWKFQLSQPNYQALSSNSHSANSKLRMLGQNHHHAHLHCKICGQITCIHELEPHFPPAALNKYQVDTVDINIRGVCLQCASLTSNK